MSSSSCEDHDSSDVLFPNVSTAAVPNQAAAEAGDRAVLTPLLRTVGNVAAGGGAPAMSQLLSHASGASRSSVDCCSTFARWWRAARYLPPPLPRARCVRLRLVVSSWLVSHHLPSCLFLPEVAAPQLCSLPQHRRPPPDMHVLIAMRSWKPRCIWACRRSGAGANAVHAEHAPRAGQGGHLGGVQHCRLPR